MKKVKLIALRIYERFWPLGVGIAAYFVFSWAHRHGMIVKDLTTAYSTLTNVGAIAIGFLATAKSILVSIKDTKPFLRDLQQVPVLYAKLMMFFRTAIVWCFLSVGLCSVALFFTDTPGQSNAHLASGIAFISVTAGCCCVRVAKHFFRILNLRDPKVSTGVEVDDHIE